MGRVDGKGGRDSYSGLEDALQSVLDGLIGAPVGPNATSGGRRATFLQTCLEVGESVLSYCSESEGESAPAPTLTSAATGAVDAATAVVSRGGRPLDLVVRALWLPVAEVLQERFGDMFTVGIPSTQSLCYRAVRHFVTKLQGVCGPVYAPAVARRLQQHPLVAAFFGQWRLDLYYQLRCKEVFRRLDRVCAAALKHGASASQQRLLDDNYSKLDGPHSSLRSDVEHQLARAGGTQSAAFSATALELRASLHPSVLLEPLVGYV